MLHFSALFRRALLSSALILASLSSQAQAPQWSTDVAPVLYNRCLSCHRSGGIAPFALASFTDAYAYRASIRAAILGGHMPPWPPDPTYNRLAHERLMSGEEKAKIIQWIDAGAPSGNLAAAPPLPTFPAGGDLPGTPDLSVRIPTYTSQASGQDIYRCFVLPTGLTSDRFITAFEALPGNRSIVHHVLIYADTTGQSTLLDAQDPGPGYTSFGGIGVNNAPLIGGWVPGTRPLSLPTGFGIPLSKNAKIVVQIHYPAGSSGLVDSTRIRFFFTPSASVRPVYTLPLLNHALNINAPLVVPANTVKTFTESQVVPPGYTLSLLGVAPHMHLIGRSINAFATTPTGDTQRIISIPDWHFHWQGFYLLRRLMKISVGSTLHSTAVYDNTPNNPYNPSSPPVDVHAGEATTDEMMLTYFIVAAYQAGDENIDIDTSALVSLTSLGVDAPVYAGQMLLAPYPNPATNELYVKTHLDRAADAVFEIVSMDGRVVAERRERAAAGYSVRVLHLRGVAVGTYALRMRVGADVKAQMMTVVR